MAVLGKLGWEFDDVVVDEDGHKWSQMCPAHADKFSLEMHILSNVVEGGSGICGVKGCTCEAEYYIDFN
jgi:hypothetical protein